MPKHILHIIKGGPIPDGIEALFLRYLRYLSADEHKPEALVLAPSKRIIRLLERAGVPTYCAGGGGRTRGMASLIKRIMRGRYALIHSWGHASNMIGSPLSVLGKTRAVWSLHDIGSSAKSVRAVEFLNTPLSHLIPSKIICVARATERVYSRRKYASEKFRFIPNGVDCREFRRDPELGANFRRQHRIPEGAPVVGMVARYLPEKGVDVFVEASSLLHSVRPDAHFVVCGWKLDPANKALCKDLRERGLWECFHLLGELESVAPLINAADLIACCSFKESFGLSIAEAMACGRPVVAPDVGDLRRIVGDASVITPVGDPQAYAERFQRLLNLPPEKLEELGAEMSIRVRPRYCLERMAAQYNALYREVSDSLPTV